jgi:signal transduction histidine kinase
MVYEQVDKLMLLERPIILVSSPILRSDGSGEARGWLIMAKYLDESWVESMQNLINAQIHFSEMKNTIGPKTTWTGKIDSIPITIEFENPFYNQFLSTFLYFEIAAVAGILLGSGFFAFLADRYGIRRILKLTDSVTRGEKAEEDKKNDEISTLIKNYNDLLEKLRSSEEEVRFLLRVMRHDVANALTGAISYLEYLKELHEKAEFERERVENIIEKIKTSLWRIHRILKTIKELEASETSKYRISEVVRAVAQYHEVEVEIKGDAMITADDGIYEVFENLTSNAVKHGNATKIFVEVIENDWVDIYFWDNGRGLPEEAWEWFSSIDKLPSLGMLIIKKFVEKYGGSFDFVEGSRFHIRLPKKLGLQ